jgi:hypothetical protein
VANRTDCGTTLLLGHLRERNIYFHFTLRLRINFVTLWIIEMYCQAYCNYPVYFLSMFLLTTSAAPAESTKTPADAAQPLPQAPTAYKEKLEEYTIARRNFDDEVTAYWKLIDEKRQNRNEKRRHGQEVLLDDYVLIQPPIYSGPARPVDPSAAPKANGVPGKKYVPVIADFLRFAAEQFQFVPQRPASEIEFKRLMLRLRPRQDWQRTKSSAFMGSKLAEQAIMTCRLAWRIPSRVHRLFLPRSATINY